MSHKHRKIEIATPDDVEKYASGGTAGSAPSPPPAAAASAAGGSPAGAAASSEASSAGGPPSPEVEALRAEVEQWKDKTLRAKAELANYQRRSNQERAAAIKYANAAFAKAHLPVVADLERALPPAEPAAA